VKSVSITAEKGCTPRLRERDCISQIVSDGQIVELHEDDGDRYWSVTWSQVGFLDGAPEDAWTRSWSTVMSIASKAGRVSIASFTSTARRWARVLRS
jgi:hypothetical protein